jgi:hypothetical protein
MKNNQNVGFILDARIENPADSKWIVRGTAFKLMTSSDANSALAAVAKPSAMGFQQMRFKSCAQIIMCRRVGHFRHRLGRLVFLVIYGFARCRLFVGAFVCG